MSIKGNEDVGYWYTPTHCEKDKIIDKYCVSLDYFPKFESWLPHSITIHECGSEGGSFYRALFTFREYKEAENLYNILHSKYMIERHLP